jgi:hypothetical protein
VPSELDFDAARKYAESVSTSTRIGKAWPKVSSLTDAYLALESRVAALRQERDELSEGIEYIANDPDGAFADEPKARGQAAALLKRDWSSAKLGVLGGGMKSEMIDSVELAALTKQRDEAIALLTGACTTLREGGFYTCADAIEAFIAAHPIGS